MNDPNKSNGYNPISMIVAANAAINASGRRLPMSTSIPKEMHLGPTDENGQFTGGRPRSIDRHDSETRRANKKRRARKGW